MASAEIQTAPQLRAAPAERAVAVTPSDSVELTVLPRALYVGTAGDLKVRTAGGDDVTFKNASGWMPVRARLVFSTLTTATDIVAVW